MVIFCWLHFSQLCSIGVETVKKINFSKKNLKNLKSSNGLNWILHYKRALKKIFSDFLLLTFGV